MNRFEPKILRYESLPSTNTEAARVAVEGATEGLTIIASEQTAGRGRMQRAWLSPRGAGLYLSIVLRPKLPLDQWPLVTFAAAVAVAETLDSDFGVSTDIKWPNDILSSERKICGILAESIETSEGRALILGIGINLTSQAFPVELNGVAVSVEELMGVAPDVDQLTTTLLGKLSHWYSTLHDEGGQSRVTEAWKERSSYAQGKTISVSDGIEVLRGVTCGIEPDGALRVATPDGEIRIVRAGDIVNVRPAG